MSLITLVRCVLRNQITYAYFVYVANHQYTCNRKRHAMTPITLLLACLTAKYSEYIAVHGVQARFHLIALHAPTRSPT